MIPGLLLNGLNYFTEKHWFATQLIDRVPKTFYPCLAQLINVLLAAMPIALSIRQPWVELILSGRKTIEVRSWPIHHRGELWIHAGKQPDATALKKFDLSVADLTFGALVGTCELYDCIEFSVEDWNRWRSKHLNDGSLERPLYAWFLKNPKRVKPIPFKGRLGLMRI